MHPELIRGLNVTERSDQQHSRAWYLRGYLGGSAWEGHRGNERKLDKIKANMRNYNIVQTLDK